MKNAKCYPEQTENVLTSKQNEEKVFRFSFNILSGSNWKAYAFPFAR